MKTDEAGYLIIGNSTAAVGCVEGIRKVDADSPIVLLSAEDRRTYSRPLISYLLAGEIDEDRMYFRPDDWYERCHVDARLGVRALSVDPQDGVVETSSGAVKFERLLIASGGTPFVPEMPGGDAEGVFTFTSWDDADAVREYLDKTGAERAVVVGGGLIGIKSAEALHARGLKVLMVELAGRVLPLALDEKGSRLAADAMARAGVELECNTTVERIAVEDGRVSGVVLKSGRMVPCEIVIVAIGVVPETSMVAGTAIEVDRGIVIDDRCETSVEGIFAAGDVSQGTDFLSGKSRPIPIFPNAYRQGSVAGTNMAGGDARCRDAFAMNSVEIFGLPTVSVGLATASGDGYDEIVAEDRDAGTYRRIAFEGDRVVGALFVGDIERAGIITGLIREKVNVAKVKELLLTEQFGLISLPEEYRKHVVSGDGMVI